MEWRRLFPECRAKNCARHSVFKATMTCPTATPITTPNLVRIGGSRRLGVASLVSPVPSKNCARHSVFKANMTCPTVTRHHTKFGANRRFPSAWSGVAFLPSAEQKLRSSQRF